jgi:hypothetical protein
VAQQPALAPAAAPPLEVLAPATLRLASRKSAAVELGLTSRIGQAQPTWIILHYDPAALEVAAPPDQRLYRAASGDELPAATAKTALPVVPHDVTTAAPSARLAPDSPIKLRFDVAARTSSREPLHIDVEAVTTSGRAWRTIEVILPMPSPVDLFARGAPGTVVATDDGYSILPWPNRQTTFQLSLSSTTERARVVDVELLAAGADLADLAFAHALTSADADEMLAKVGHLETIVRLAEVKVPPRGESVQLKFPERAVPPPEGTKPPVPAPEPAPAAMQPMAIADRLMVVVRERATDQVLVRRLIVAPQLPRRYVRPTVGYSRELERLFVRVEPQDRSLLPPGGVKVHLDIAEELPPATEGSFDARLDADNPRAELYVRMLPGDKTLTARVTVDGYPRAFVYRVPCRRPLQDVPEEIGLRNVEVLAPPANKSFGAPATSIPAEFRIDAPLGSFQRAGDFVEFGLDPNRNREFDGEPTLHFSNDRQVQVNLVRLASTGELTLETAVGDFKVELPATGLRNGRVGVLGRLFVEGRSTYSRPREIILDAEGPRIDRIQLRPARPLVLDKDKEIEALVWVNDGDLSGAAGVQGLVDTQGLGKFAPDAKPVPGVQDPERHWLLKLPAAGLLPGTHRLLLRAIDKVGNSGPYKGIDFQLISEKEGAVLQAQLVTGTVLYGDQGIADAKVTLAPAKGEKIEPVTTDAQGNFSFAKVPPGKYKLHAEAVVRNKTRKADVEVEVAPAPAAVKPQRLVFK